MSPRFLDFDTPLRGYSIGEIASADRELNSPRCDPVFLDRGRIAPYNIVR